MLRHEEDRVDVAEAGIPMPSFFPLSRGSRTRAPLTLCGTGTITHEAFDVKRAMGER